MTYEQVQNYLRHETAKAERASAMVDAMLKAQAATPIARMAESFKRLTPNDWIKLTWSSTSTKPAPAARAEPVPAQVQAKTVEPLPNTTMIAASLRARAERYRAAGGSLKALCRAAGVHKDSISELARIVRGDWPHGLSTTRVDRLSSALADRGF